MEQINLESIIIDREGRQRRVLRNVEELAASFKANGQIQPVVLDENQMLVAGERRCAAARTLGWTTIGAVRLEDLTPAAAKIIELEENIRRDDMTWQDRARAFAEIRQALLNEVPSGTKVDLQLMSERLGQSDKHISKMLTLAEELQIQPEGEIGQFASFHTAYNALGRRTARAAEGELESMLGGGLNGLGLGAGEEEGKGDSESGAEKPESRQDAIPALPPAGHVILCENFIQWAAEYSGARFNFLHCDFPYGLNHDKSAQGGADRWGSYEDSNEIYWELLEALAENQDRLLATSAHMLFWFSMNNYTATMQFFQQHLSSWTFFPHPLIWFKSDNTGILPDPQRGPRRIYETALLGVRGDRKVVKAVANAHSCRGRDPSFIHQSQKPEAMLRHFFSMLVDESTHMLDPTCGSGTSIRAGAKCGAAIGLGLEQDQEMATSASHQLSSQLRQATVQQELFNEDTAPGASNV